MKSFLGAAALSAAILAASGSAWAGCDVEDMARKGQEVAAAVEAVAPQVGEKIDPQEYSDRAQKLQEGQMALSSGDYDKACEAYDEFLAWAGQYQ